MYHLLYIIGFFVIYMRTCMHSYISQSLYFDICRINDNIILLIIQNTLAGKSNSLMLIVTDYIRLYLFWKEESLKISQITIFSIIGLFTEHKETSSFCKLFITHKILFQNLRLYYRDKNPKSVKMCCFIKRNVNMTYLL